MNIHVLLPLKLQMDKFFGLVYSGTPKERVIPTNTVKNIQEYFHHNPNNVLKSDIDLDELEDFLDKNPEINDDNLIDLSKSASNAGHFELIVMLVEDFGLDSRSIFNMILMETSRQINVTGLGFSLRKNIRDYVVDKMGGIDSFSKSERLEYMRTWPTYMRIGGHELEYIYLKDFKKSELIHDLVDGGNFHHLRFILLESPKLVNLRDLDYRTPLFYAKTIKMVKLLHDYGANFKVVDINKQTPLQYAAYFPHYMKVRNTFIKFGVKNADEIYHDIFQSN